MKDTSQFNEDFAKSHSEHCDGEYFLEIDVQYPEKIHEIHHGLPFLIERLKIEKVEKFVTNFYDKTKVIHKRNLKQVLNHGLVLKKSL